jgi:hypothetical protein
LVSVLGGDKVGFSNIKSLSNSRQLNEKANKALETFISATLLNGWSASNGIGIQYAKNDLGLIILNIGLIGGTAINSGTKIATLPSGYRPISSMPMYLCSQASGATSLSLSIEQSGDIILRTAFTTGNIYTGELVFYTK